MRYSGIGGQAVMEGVMMKNKNRYAVAVRKPDHEIEVMTKEYKGIVSGEIWQKIPLVRGVLSFIVFTGAWNVYLDVFSLFF